ncbi:DUF6270 domain-containing protein [Ornithinimicrobium panacihumi]|uniref:DUF6270 domain-containing protein n=1 Tax=Ornithinimicrobium panacihumi TaxID=2008449 RepID=UPI003F8C4FC1
MTPIPRIRTFIYGSCVSRDTFEFLDPQRFELSHYIARQSLASAFSTPNDLAVPPFSTSSNFQRRMLVGDWRGNLVQSLRQHQDSIDLLLWDLCDERLGLYRLPNASIVTRSVDSLSTGLDQELRPHPHVPFGSPAHRQRFELNLGQFADLLDELDLRSRTLLLAPPWATHFPDGQPAPSSYGLTPDHANDLFDVYHARVEARLGIHVVRDLTSPPRASRSHRWGPAPFHYDHATYTALAAQVSQAAGRPVARLSK